MTLPKLIPLKLSTSNPMTVPEYNFNIKLAQKTGTNGPRDLFSAYNVDFFERYTAAFAKTLESEILIGYDGSRVHQSISVSAREYLRRCGLSIKELDGPVTVPEFMFACYQLKVPGCFFGRSHSPQQYIGLKLVINAKNAFQLLEKNGAEITCPPSLESEKIYGFLPRTLAPVVEEAIKDNVMVHPKEIGRHDKIEASALREEFFTSIKKVVPLKKIEGEYIVDCRHSMAGPVWELIKSEMNADIVLHNDVLNPIAPDRDPREIWGDLTQKYMNQSKAVFNHDGDADRIFLLKIPGKGQETIVDNQEESFTTGLIAESKSRKSDAYILVQERISLIMLSALSELTKKVYATAQGEPAFFLGVTELLTRDPNMNRISGADYTNIFFNKTHPICMKSPFQQALWLMNWFTNDNQLPKYPSVDVVRTQIDMVKLDYPQRLQKVLNSTEEINKYFNEQFQVVYHSSIDGQNLILKDKKENMLIVSIRPSGTGRYTKVFSEIGLGTSTSKERKTIAEEVNKTIEKIITK
ncbi:MAG: hypothetical protein KAX09_01825 [Candidatus Heimdallarchaeota archaeon]|nr:hypothetical protein [Candidatus Heimdallarchaeota archaeon]MCK4289699.1 hypothetical protein [Candidatus Heimdallarchaeota archaeon]